MRIRYCRARTFLSRNNMTVKLSLLRRSLPRVVAIVFVDLRQMRGYFIPGDVVARGLEAE